MVVLCGGQWVEVGQPLDKTTRYQRGAHVHISLVPAAPSFIVLPQSQQPFWGG